MLENSSHPQDTKVASPQDKPDDVERGAPPRYPLVEPEELTVGQRRGCFRRKYCGRRGACDGTKYSKGRCIMVRLIKFFVVAAALLGVAHFFFVGVTFHKAYKTIQCTTITPSTDNGKPQHTFPFAHSSSHLFIHDSLTAGDIVITRDSSVEDGTLALGAKFSEDAKGDEVYDGCIVQVGKGTGVALIPREKNSTNAQLESLVVRFPSSATAPAVSILGKNHKKLSNKKLRKLIKWWRKHHCKKTVESKEEA